jgi:RNA recognition motif-containing protein
MNIYVGNLSYGVDDGALQAAFGEFGQVASAQVVKDKETGRSRGFGFIEMPVQAEAEAAIKALNGKELDGRAISVNEARPKPDRGGRGGGGGGDRGGDRGGSGGGRGGGDRGGRRW